MYDADGHASHEACELKSGMKANTSAMMLCHASHEACELKSISQIRRKRFYPSRLA